MHTNITDTLSAEQVEDAIKRALPGFENRILVEEHTRMIIVEAKGPVWFFGKAHVDPYRLPLATNEANEAFGEHVREMVRATRAHAILQLGLDEEIKQQVEENTRAAVAAEKERWEQEGWRKGYSQATADVTQGLMGSLRNAILGNDEPPLVPNGDGS